MGKGKIRYKIFTIVHNVVDKSLMRGVTRYVFLPSLPLPLPKSYGASLETFDAGTLSFGIARLALGATPCHDGA